MNTNDNKEPCPTCSMAVDRSAIKLAARVRELEAENADLKAAIEESHRWSPAFKKLEALAEQVLGLHKAPPSVSRVTTVLRCSVCGAADNCGHVPNCTGSVPTGSEADPPSVSEAEVGARWAVAACIKICEDRRDHFKRMARSEAAATKRDDAYAHEAGECAEAIKTWALRDAAQVLLRLPPEVAALLRSRARAMSLGLSAYVARLMQD